MKELLSGNEAVARGAFEADVKLASAYPGTPSTEIMETIGDKFPSLYAQWSPNEKVAYEVGVGASVGGGRALVTMKHVGLNVAADPYMTHAYTGVNGGFLIVSADDPEMHSSQNEQDNRFFAKFANIPMLEPADSQESKDMVVMGYEISEIFDTPVLFRMTTRISHSKGIVELQEPTEGTNKKYVKDSSKYVMIPSHARARHIVVEERIQKLQNFSEETLLNFVEDNGSKIGIITSGVSYQYAKEVEPNFDYMKLGFTFPLPIKKIEEFVKNHDVVLVVEELEPFIEDQIKVAGIKVEGKKYFGKQGELSPYRVAEGFHKAGIIDAVKIAEIGVEKDMFPRPPVLCPGCPHRGAFMALKKAGIAVAGDIGCYTLGVMEPLNAMDTCVCMGASIGNAIGMEKVQASDKGTVAVIGDSTFFHSGITGILDAVYNNSNVTVMILDNSITAMTGGQQHPSTGKTLMGKDTVKVDIANLVRALGVKRVINVDAYDYDQVLSVIKEEVATKEPSVILTTRPCVLMPARIMDEPFTVDLELCTACSACFKISCPAISASDETNKHDRPKAIIDATICTGCTLCAQVCPPEAIMLKSQFVEA